MCLIVPVELGGVMNDMNLLSKQELAQLGNWLRMIGEDKLVKFNASNTVSALLGVGTKR